MSNLKNYLFTSESVSEGHPDKVSDRISDMVVDSYLSNDPFSRVACETLTTTNKVVLAGEVRGPEIKKDDLIINISEDGWFGKSIGPKQHFAHSIFRAIESGKYVVRSSNNGMTAVINPLGNIEQKINFGQSDYIDLEGIKKIQPTIFSYYGNKILGFLILLYIFLIFSFNKIKNE